MKDWKLICEKQKELITTYQIFTKWVLRHTPEIEQSQRGKDCLEFIDKNESELAQLESEPDIDNVAKTETDTGKLVDLPDWVTDRVKTAKRTPTLTLPR